MTQTHTQYSPTTPKREKKPINGVDVPTLVATLGAVKEAPELAAFTFRTTTRWRRGTHSVTTPGAFDGAGGQHEHVSTYEIDIDHPAVLVGEDQGPTPVEYVLGALAGCLTAGIGNVASIRGVKLTKVTAHVTGKIDLNGIFGLSDVRNGFQDIVVRFEIEGDAPAEQLRAVVEQSKARSAVFDIITNPTPVTVEIDA